MPIASRLAAIGTATALLCAAAAPVVLLQAATTPARAQTEPARPGIFVSAAELLPQLAHRDLRIVDLRSRSAFEKGHIPGAVNLPWQELSVSEVEGVRNEFAPDAVLAEKFGAAGLSYDDRIVLVDGGTLAGRGYVTFEYAGFPRVQVLDGGFPAWKGPVETAAFTPIPTRFTLSRKQENRVGQDFVASRLGKPDAVIVDGRAADAFKDGHIPTAASVPNELYLDPASLRKPRAQLLAELAARGLTPDREIVSYCGSGVAAANAYLVLKDLGFQNVVLYDGSWDEWSRDPKAGQEVALPNYTWNASLGGGQSFGPRFLTQDEVRALQARPDVVVLDVRAPSDFNAGRIPGSVNLFWNDTLDAERNLKGAEELAALYRAKGVTPDKHVVVFTRGGLQLAHTFTVLKLLGFERVDAFTGTFEGWLNRSFGQG